MLQYIHLNSQLIAKVHKEFLWLLKPEIHYYACTADVRPIWPRPTYDQLIKVDGSNLKVILWITSLEQWQCSDFAHKLLKDDVQVNKYEQECKKKDEFVRKVLKDWLSRNDDDHNDSAALRTWAALAECAADAGLPGALAKAIRDTFLSGLSCCM